jgi:hypothetical protein
MTTATTVRTSELGSGTTSAEKESITAPSEEQKPQRRFVPRFMHKSPEKGEREEETEKKQPWYKGKKLYHATMRSRSRCATSCSARSSIPGSMSCCWQRL